MDNEKTQKKYVCEGCDYSTSNKYDFNRHILTRKHKMDNKKRIFPKKNARGSQSQKNKVVKKKYDCVCGKSYVFMSGLCKHRHTCSLLKQHVAVEIAKNDENQKINNKNTPAQVTTEMFNNALQQQQQLIDTIVEMSKKRNTTNYYNNCNNKKMTINVFLNEECKDAMNLTDFIENVKVGLDDLLYTKEHGYVKGISNIFVKHLQDLDPRDRPIHCSDKKRLQFYIKEENKWGKDANNIKIDKSIDDVSKKQVKQLVEWQKQHPDYEKDDTLLNEYFKITRHVMGGGDISEVVQNGTDIKKNISNNVEIKGAMIDDKET